MTSPIKYRFDTLGKKTPQVGSICKKVQNFNLVQYLGLVMQASVPMKRKCDYDWLVVTHSSDTLVHTSPDYASSCLLIYPVAEDTFYRF